MPSSNDENKENLPIDDKTIDIGKLKKDDIDRYREALTKIEKYREALAKIENLAELSTDQQISEVFVTCKRAHDAFEEINEKDLPGADELRNYLNRLDYRLRKKSDLIQNSIELFTWQREYLKAGKSEFNLVKKSSRKIIYEFLWKAIYTILFLLSLAMLVDIVTRIFVGGVKFDSIITLLATSFLSIVTSGTIFKGVEDNINRLIRDGFGVPENLVNQVLLGISVACFVILFGTFRYLPQIGNLYVGSQDEVDPILQREQEYRRAVAINPSNVDANLGLGEVYLATGEGVDYEKALQQYRLVLKMVGDENLETLDARYEAKKRIAQIAFETKNYTLANNSLRNLIEDRDRIYKIYNNFSRNQNNKNSVESSENSSGFNREMSKLSKDYFIPEFVEDLEVILNKTVKNMLQSRLDTCTQKMQSSRNRMKNECSFTQFSSDEIDKIQKFSTQALKNQILCRVVQNDSSISQHLYKTRNLYRARIYKDRRRNIPIEIRDRFCSSLVDMAEDFDNHFESLVKENLKEQIDDFSEYFEGFQIYFGRLSIKILIEQIEQEIEKNSSSENLSNKKFVDSVIMNLKDRLEDFDILFSENFKEPIFLYWQNKFAVLDENSQEYSEFRQIWVNQIEDFYTYIIKTSLRKELIARREELIARQEDFLSYCNDNDRCNAAISNREYTANLEKKLTAEFEFERELYTRLERKLQTKLEKELQNKKFVFRISPQNEASVNSSEDESTLYQHLCIPDPYNWNIFCSFLVNPFRDFNTYNNFKEFYESSVKQDLLYTVDNFDAYFELQIRKYFLNKCIHNRNKCFNPDSPDSKVLKFLNGDKDTFNNLIGNVSSEISNFIFHNNLQDVIENNKNDLNKLDEEISQVLELLGKLGRIYLFGEINLLADNENTNINLIGGQEGKNISRDQALSLFELGSDVASGIDRWQYYFYIHQALVHIHNLGDEFSEAELGYAKRDLKNARQIIPDGHAVQCLLANAYDSELKNPRTQQKENEIEKLILKFNPLFYYKKCYAREIPDSDFIEDAKRWRRKAESRLPELESDFHELIKGKKLIRTKEYVKVDKGNSLEDQLEARDFQDIERFPSIIENSETIDLKPLNGNVEYAEFIDEKLNYKYEPTANFTGSDAFSITVKNISNDDSTSQETTFIIFVNVVDEPATAD